MQQNPLSQKPFKSITIRPRSNEHAPAQNQNSYPAKTFNSSTVSLSQTTTLYSGVNTEVSDQPKQLIVFRAKQKLTKEPPKKTMPFFMLKMRKDVLSLVAQLLIIIQLFIIKVNFTVSLMNTSLQIIWMAILNYPNLIKKTLPNKQESPSEVRESITRPLQPAGDYTINRNDQTRRIHRGVKPLTLVLDLDETLIHSSRVRPEKEYEALLVSFVFYFVLLLDQVEQSDGTFCQVYLRKRPHLNLFLEKVSEEYNLIIFTASTMKYADAAIDSIDTGFRIGRRLYRQSCIKSGNGWVKDLRKLDTDLSRVIFIDNEELAGSLQPSKGSQDKECTFIGNYLSIKPWTHSDDDKELLRYMDILLEFAKDWKSEANDSTKKDVRNFVSKIQKEWKMELITLKEQ